LSSRILVIPDAQVKDGVDIEHLKWCGEYLVEKKPDTVVCLGDFWDFESLSFYDKGTLSFEGRRLKKDIDVGKEAMELMLKPLKDLQERQRANKKKVYEPRLVFTLGNHCERLMRVPKSSPEFAGFIGYELLDLERHGWEVYDFLLPVEIEGIYFVHFLANPMTGKPYGGTATSMLKNVGKSFVQGHKQTLDIAVRPTIDGKMQIGIIAGAFYQHEEAYKGYTGNNHWRGMVMLNNAKDGYADPCFISIDYLKKKYGNK
jgi:hypothetical protein